MADKRQLMKNAHYYRKHTGCSMSLALLIAWALVAKVHLLKQIEDEDFVNRMCDHWDQDLTQERLHNPEYLVAHNKFVDLYRKALAIKQQHYDILHNIRVVTIISTATKTKSFESYKDWARKRYAI